MKRKPHCQPAAGSRKRRHRAAVCGYGILDDSKTKTSAAGTTDTL